MTGKIHIKERATKGKVLFPFDNFESESDGGAGEKHSHCTLLTTAGSDIKRGLSLNALSTNGNVHHLQSFTYALEGKP